MSSNEPRDFFDKARAVAVMVLVVAGLAAIAGTFLDWVTIEPPARVPNAQADRLAAFTGLETSDGRLIVLAGIVVLGSAVALSIRKTSGPAWLAFAASIVIGAIAIADYRGIDTLFYDEMQRIGRPFPAFGLKLVAAAGILGLIGSVAGIAATPKRESSG